MLTLVGRFEFVVTQAVGPGDDRGGGAQEPKERCAGRGAEGTAEDLARGGGDELDLEEDGRHEAAQESQPTSRAQGGHDLGREGQQDTTGHREHRGRAAQVGGVQGCDVEECDHGCS